MAYVKQDWKSNDLITADKLNHIEDGIPTKTSQLTNDSGFLTSHQSIPEATTSATGLMSSSDKTKLNGIESGAQVNSVTGVKGGAENDYRTGNVDITLEDIGAVAKTGDTMTGDLTFEKDSSSEITLKAKPNAGYADYASLQLGIWTRGSGNQGLYSYGYYDSNSVYQNKETWLIHRKNNGKVYFNGIYFSLFEDSTARTLSPGTQTYDKQTYNKLSDLTSDYYVAFWRFSGGYSDNNPPADITVNTFDGGYSVTVTNLKEEGITMQPIFIR